MDQADIVARLRRLGWTVEERSDWTFRLPPEVAARHPHVPAALTEFLSGLSACVNRTQTEWFLCEADFHGTSGGAFRWDEWERMSLEAAGNAAETAEVRAFWDAHLPFLLSVRDGYAYLAVRTAPDGFGRVVAGREPEFEEASLVAGIFEQFLLHRLGELEHD